MPKQIGEDLIAILAEIDRLRSEKVRVIELLKKSHETGWLKYSVEALEVCQSPNPVVGRKNAAISDETQPL